MSSINKEYYILEYKDDIFFVDYNEGTEITKEILRNMLQNMLDLSKGIPFAVYSDITKNISSTAEARIYGAKNEFTNYIIASAVVTNNLAVKIMVNFFISFNKPEKPVRLFKNKMDAVHWLKNQVELYNRKNTTKG